MTRNDFYNFVADKCDGQLIGTYLDKKYMAITEDAIYEYRLGSHYITKYENGKKTIIGVR